MNLYFCSFADKRFHKSLKRIKLQAIQMEVFSDVFCFNEKNLSTDFIKKYDHFLTPNTFYLCAWKPQVVLECMSRMKEGEVLLYADSGCHLNHHGIKRLNEYSELVTKSKSGILATVLHEDNAERVWTKGDAFDYFGVRADQRITNSPHIQATTFLIQKRTSTIQFLQKWLKVFDDPLLADRGHCKAPNLDGYIEHRSDQSFFSILAKLENIELVSSDEVQGSAKWETDMIQFPIWAKRDKVIDNSFWVHPTPGRLYLLIKQRVRKYIG